MYKILIVEDDELIAQSIKEHLVNCDYNAQIATDFKNIIKSVNEFSPQLILMDINLPYKTGYYHCMQIRNFSDVPIVFISSASDNMNIIMAMDMGGDDFISKPFSLDVLSAKITAVLRRTYTKGQDLNILEHKSIILNLSDFSLAYKDNIEILSKNEFKILQILFENAGKVVSRDNMILKLWNSERFIDDNTLTVNITRIRRRLEAIGLYDFIKTKKGVGYIVE